MPYVVVEYLYDPPLTDEIFLSSDDGKMEACLEARGVTWVITYLGTDRVHRFCVFQAPDAESVREAFRSAGVAFVRAWTAERFTP